MSLHRRTDTPAYRLTEAERADLGARIRDAAPGPQTAFAVQPGSTVHIDTGADPDDALVPWERALDLVKNVVVIVTCAVVLYTIWRGYVALGALGDALDQLQATWGGR